MSTEQELVEQCNNMCGTDTTCKILVDIKGANNCFFVVIYIHSYKVCVAGALISINDEWMMLVHL